MVFFTDKYYVIRCIAYLDVIKSLPIVFFNVIE
ncbi:hypothetical protein IWX76_000483 [Pedobacter sp. CAN_A7]